MSTYNIPAITITEDVSGKHAVIDYNYSGSEFINIPEDITVDSVTLNKTFDVSDYTSIQLPFEVNTANLVNVKAVLRYNGIRYDNTASIRMKIVWATDDFIPPYHYEHQTLETTQPYLFVTTDTTVGINGAVTLKKSATSRSTIDTWSFCCLNRKRIITIDDITYLHSTYGFDGTDFVRLDDSSELLALQTCIERDPFYSRDPEYYTHDVVRRRQHIINVSIQ